MGVGVAIGGLALSAYSAYRGRKDGKKAERASRARLEFERQLSEEAKAEREEQRARWDRMFGPMEKNIAKFYSGLDRDFVIAQGNEALAESYEISKASTIEQLRANGLDIEDGVGAGALSQIASNHADARAKLYATAESTVASMQQQALAASGGRPGSGAQQNFVNHRMINQGFNQLDQMSMMRRRNTTNNMLDFVKGAGAIYGEYMSNKPALASPAVNDISVSNPSIYHQINSDDGYLF